MPLNVLNGPVIPEGEYLSAPLDIGNAELVTITMPDAWSGGLLTLAISPDGARFTNLHGFDGREIAINVGPGTTVVVPHDIARGIAFLMLRSGTADFPEVQDERREFSIGVVSGAHTRAPTTKARRKK